MSDTSFLLDLTDSVKDADAPKIDPDALHAPEEDAHTLTRTRSHAHATCTPTPTHAHAHACTPPPGVTALPTTRAPYSPPPPPPHSPTPDYDIKDGERLPLAVKDLGSCDLYPQSLQHNPNGRFVTVCGDGEGVVHPGQRQLHPTLSDCPPSLLLQPSLSCPDWPLSPPSPPAPSRHAGEYITYTALAWRNKSFGTGLEFVWSSDSNDYALRETGNKVKLYKNFQVRGGEGLAGGGVTTTR